MDDSESNHEEVPEMMANLSVVALDGMDPENSKELEKDKKNMQKAERQRASAGGGRMAIPGASLPRGARLHLVLPGVRPRHGHPLPQGGQVSGASQQPPLSGRARLRARQVAARR